jgi:membrane-associated phospholipid phosphatase
MVPRALAVGAVRGALAALCAVAILCVASRAHAGDPVVWHPEWPKFRWTEGVATVGLIATSYAEDRYLSGPATPQWTGAILLDNEVRGVVRGPSIHVQRTASKYADVGFAVLTLFPYFDVAIALGVHRSPEVAAQMFLIDTQAQSFTSSVTLLTKWLVGRQRPYARDCTPGGTAGIHTCGTSYDNIGFFSGHTSATFTGAALTCVHHEHLPLYGGGAPDTWACVWALIGASSTGILRIVSDDHYASDVIVAAGVGFLSGYVMPSWLHYGFGRTGTTKKTNRGGSAQIVPTLQPVVGGIAIGLAGSM